MTSALRIDAQIPIELRPTARRIDHAFLIGNSDGKITADEVRRAPAGRYVGTAIP